MKTEKDMMMYYQTTLRNTGLFTTVSFAALGYSRFYRGKDKLFNVALILASIVFMVLTVYLAKYMVEDITVWQKELKSDHIEKYLLLPRAVYVVNVGLLTLALYTLFREVVK
jgi:hypothetical protein